MKKTMKLLAGALSAVCLCAPLSALHTAAWDVLPVTALDQMIREWEEQTGETMVRDMDYSDSEAVWYVSDQGTVIWGKKFQYNVTNLSFANGDGVTAHAIYDKYKEALDFDYENWSEDIVYRHELSLFLCDKSDDPTNPAAVPSDFVNKQAIITEMLKEMVDAGVEVRYAHYEESSFDCFCSGYSGITAYTETEEQAEAVKVIVNGYECECIRGPEIVSAGRDGYVYLVTFGNKPTYAVMQEIRDKINAEVEGAKASLEITFAFEPNDVSTGTVDLLPLADPTLGDVNLDGKIDLTDTILVKKYDAGAVTLEEEQKANADLDGNGTVDSNDAVQLLRFLLRLEESIG